jgi:hypothetical protein
MARFGFVGPSYQSQSVNADCQLCMNWYLEAIESQQGKGAMALYPRPGLNRLYSLGAAGVRGMIDAQGRGFAIAGTQLWELLAPTASPNKINRGAVVSDGQPVSMTSGPNQVLLVSAGIGYVFDMTANTLTDISAAIGAPPVAQVGYADGFYFALLKDSNKVQSSNELDATTWPGENAFVVSVFPDNVKAMFFDHREMWLFGRRATQPYGDAGDFPEPFDAIGGAYIETGIAAPFSPAKLDNSIVWLGSDERGNGMVWRAQGYTPTRISNHALEFALQGYATIEDAVGYSYQDQGHSHYVLSFPTAEKTWDYDAATGMWTQLGFWNAQAGIFTRHRGQYHLFLFGMHLVGDPTVGDVYQQSITIYSDFGSAIRRVRRAPHISNEQTFIFHHSLQVDVETGLHTFADKDNHGSAAPTIISILDAGGGVRSFGIGENGIIQAPSNPAGDPLLVERLLMNDQANTTSWEITVNAFGVIAPVLQSSYVDSYPQAIKFVSALGDQNWVLQLQNIGSGVAIPQAVPLGFIGRGPLMMMRFSNDGGRSWSNEQTRDCGMAGETKKRVIWRRLGRSRDRVYEIAVSDAVPWRIIDAYLDATPGYGPQERIVHEMRKRA